MEGCGQLVNGNDSSLSCVHQQCHEVVSQPGLRRGRRCASRVKKKGKKRDNSDEGHLCRLISCGFGGDGGFSWVVRRGRDNVGACKGVLVVPTPKWSSKNGNDLVGSQLQVGAVVGKVGGGPDCGSPYATPRVVFVTCKPSEHINVVRSVGLNEPRGSAWQNKVPHATFRKSWGRGRISLRM